MTFLSLSFPICKMKEINKSLSLKSFLTVPVKDCLPPISMIEWSWLKTFPHISMVIRSSNTALYADKKSLKELRTPLSNFTLEDYPILVTVINNHINMSVSLRKHFGR